jgi:hypothetical protein
MPKLDFDASKEPTFADFDSPTSVEIKQLIAKLQQSHELRYKMINLETWALAQTMDSFLPGFWSRFLANRRTALQQFLERKRTLKSSTESGVGSRESGVGSQKSGVGSQKSEVRSQESADKNTYV